MIVQTNQSLDEMSSVESRQPEGVFSNLRSHLVPLLGLFVIVWTVYAPLLLHPHWGMFSDAGQILEECRKFYDAHGMRLDILFDQYRPGFNIVDKLVWLVSPERPFGFYFVRWIVFEATVLLSYLNCFTLSRSRIFSFAFSLFWFTAAATYEVIYTLDKAEIYLAFLFSAILFVCLNVQERLSEKRISARDLGRSRLLALCLVAYAIFTKQTGMLALGLTAVFATSTFVAHYLFSSVKPKWLPEVQRDVSESQFDWAFRLFKVCLCPCLAFAAFFVIAGGLQFKYGATRTSLSYVLAQVTAYCSIVPELFGLLACCLVGVIAVPIIRKSFFAVHPYRFVYATSFFIAGMVGCVGLSSWVGNLAYIWFPLYALILPASCYFVAALFERGKLSRISCLVGMALVLGLLVPGRMLEGRLQYKMDELAGELSARLAELAPPSGGKEVRMVLPFVDSARTEVGERVEALTLQRLIPHYIQRKAKERTPIRFFNVFGYNAPRDVQRMPAQPAIPIIDSCAGDCKDGPGMNVFSYWSDSFILNTRWMPNVRWHKDRLKDGDILVMPYGDLTPGISAYRGLALFVEDWRAQLQHMPQIHAKPIFSVEQRIRRTFGLPYTIGWVALRIDKVDPISWPITGDGWLMHGDWIDCAASIEGQNLLLDTHLNFPRSIRTTTTIDGVRVVKTVRATKSTNDMMRFEIPIPRDKSGDSRVMFLESDDPATATGDPRPLMLHVDRESIQ